MNGVVLAGGASRRFGGRPKGLIALGGRPMALHLAELLSGFCSRVAIEAPPSTGYEALGLPLLHAEPEHSGKGPLAGMAAGLADAGDRRVAFAPCDMPLLTGEIFEGLVRACDRNRLAGAYAATAKGREPLVAVLHANMLKAIRAALKRDEIPQTYEVLEKAGARMIAFADDEAFANVNTPDDLERVVGRL